RGVLQPSSRVDAPAPNERGEANPVAHEGPDPITNVEDVGEIARVTFSEIEEVEVAAESNGEPTREQLLEAVQQQLGAWVEGMDDVINQPGDRVALDRAVQLFFRPWPDRLAMTAEAKATSGISDTLAGMSEAAHSVHGSAAAIHGMLSGSMIGGALLTLAGIRELKDGSTDMRRLKKLIEPLKAYRDVLKELHQELASSGSGQAQEVVGSNLKGVEARLRAARQQVAEALVGMPTSASLAVAGGLSIAGGATAMAHASVAAGALGAAYGSLVTAYGVTTAVQSGQRLKDLRGLLEKVNGELDQDSSLRQHLTVMLGHEMDARKHEIAGRSALAAAGAASAGLQIAGLALAVPTVGTSLGLTAAGVAMGAAGAAAFRPIKSRHRGLNAVGGVEMTTGLPATFLYEPEHLEHLTSKINDQGDIAERCRREIIEHATAREDDGLRQFKYTFRLHRALAKVIPSADRSALANRMVSHPQSVADASLQFMLGTTEFERHYLEQQKVPALEKEVRHLMDEFNAPATENPEADRTKKALIGEILAVKADALMVDSARLEMLQDLEQRLNRSKRFLGTEFLRDSAYRKEWEDLQVDFIVAHDLAAEALSRKRLNSVQRQLDARADGDEKVSQDPLRDALRKHVGARFARVFAHAYPEKVAYERRGALEVARAMFMADMKNERTEEGDAQPA
ncbi:MAG TPA: hypothetical protein VFP68_09440, partial [Burkholderiaceae bacterium]|nr:hypothetical protein [Burkholderiaceae bacterium]